MDIRCQSQKRIPGENVRHCTQEPLSMRIIPESAPEVATVEPPCIYGAEEETKTFCLKGNLLRSLRIAPLGFSIVLPFCILLSYTRMCPSWGIKTKEENALSVFEPCPNPRPGRISLNLPSKVRKERADCGPDVLLEFSLLTRDAPGIFERMQQSVTTDTFWHRHLPHE